ncbi:hypothetical protein BC628DRAFT_1333201 [Trametes gibbosa]|nr:hypothetical protein BC628DRAFT_1333201 [Trametes gibbosa]
MTSLTASQVLGVAQKTIEILEEKGLKCCLMGSAASYLYGVERTPNASSSHSSANINDVDLVVLTNTYGQESLKELLVRANSQYTLVRSRNPRATYRVLWYRIPDTFQRCKVDILIPGILNIPDLQGWADHRASHRADMRSKQYLDVHDVNALLKIVHKRGLRIDGEDSTWVPETMVRNARSTLREYVISVAGYASDWKAIGIDIEGETAVAEVAMA